MIDILVKILLALAIVFMVALIAFYVGVMIAYCVCAYRRWKWKRTYRKYGCEEEFTWHG